MVEHCAAVGRDPAEIDRSIGWNAPSWPQDDEVSAYADAGVVSFTVGINGPDYDFEFAGLDRALAWRDAYNKG